MGFKDFGSERFLSDDVDDLLMKQANIRCEAGAEPPGEEGMEVHQTDDNRVAIHNGSAWIRTGWWAASGRTGCRLERSSTQSISNAVDTAIQWNSEIFDSDGFYPGSGGTITVPAGLGGLYLASIKTDWSAPVGGFAGFMQFVVGAVDYPIGIPEAMAKGGGSHLLALAAGDEVVVEVGQASGGSLNMTAHLEFFRLGA